MPMPTLQKKALLHKRTRSKRKPIARGIRNSSHPAVKCREGCTPTASTCSRCTRSFTLPGVPSLASAIRPSVRAAPGLAAIPAAPPVWLLVPLAQPVLVEAAQVASGVCLCARGLPARHRAARPSPVSLRFWWAQRAAEPDFCIGRLRGVFSLAGLLLLQRSLGCGGLFQGSGLGFHRRHHWCDWQVFAFAGVFHFLAARCFTGRNRHGLSLRWLNSWRRFLIRELFELWLRREFFRNLGFTPHFRAKLLHICCGTGIFPASVDFHLLNLRRQLLRRCGGAGVEARCEDAQ